MRPTILLSYVVLCCFGMALGLFVLAPLVVYPFGLKSNSGKELEKCTAVPQLFRLDLDTGRWLHRKGQNGCSSATSLLCPGRACQRKDSRTLSVIVEFRPKTIHETKNTLPCYFSSVEVWDFFRGKTILYYPVMLSHFLNSLGNYTRRAIAPKMCKINQSSVVLSVDFLIDGESILTWLVFWTGTARSVLTGAGLKWLNITGWYNDNDAFLASGIKEVLPCQFKIIPLAAVHAK